MISIILRLVILSVILLAGLVSARDSTFSITVTQPDDGSDQWRDDHQRVQRTAQEVRDQFNALQRDVDLARANPHLPHPESITKSFGENPNLDGIHKNLRKMKHMNLNIAHMRKPDPDHGVARADMVNNVVTLDPKWHGMDRAERAAMLTHEASHIGARTTDWFLRVKQPNGPDVFHPANYGEARQRPDLRNNLVMGYHWFAAGRKIMLKEGSPYTHMNADSMSAGGFHAKYNKGENSYDRKVAYGATGPTSHYRDPSGWHFLTGQEIPPVAMSPGGHGHPPLPPTPPKQSSTHLPLGPSGAGAGSSTGPGTQAYAQTHHAGTYGMTQTLGGHRRSNTLTGPPPTQQRRPSFSAGLGTAPWPVPPANPVRPHDSQTQHLPRPGPFPHDHLPPVPPPKMQRPTGGRLAAHQRSSSTAESNTVPFPGGAGGRGAYGSHIKDLPPSPPKLARPIRSSTTGPGYDTTHHYTGPSTSTSHLPHDPYRQRYPSTGPVRPRIPSHEAPRPSNTWHRIPLDQLHHGANNAATTRPRIPSNPVQQRRPSLDGSHTNPWGLPIRQPHPSNAATTRPRLPSGPSGSTAPIRLNYVPAPIPLRHGTVHLPPGPIAHHPHGPAPPVRPVVPHFVQHPPQPQPHPRLRLQRSQSLLNPPTTHHPRPQPPPLHHPQHQQHHAHGPGPSHGPPPLAHPQGQPRPPKLSLLTRVAGVFKKKDGKK